MSLRLAVLRSPSPTVRVYPGLRSLSPGAGVMRCEACPREATMGLWWDPYAQQWRTADPTKKYQPCTEQRHVQVRYCRWCAHVAARLRTHPLPDADEA